MYQTEIFPNRTIAQSLRQQIIEKKVAVSIHVNNMGVMLPCQTAHIAAFESCLEDANEVWILAEAESLSLGEPILLTLSTADPLAYWLSFSLVQDNPLYHTFLDLTHEDIRGFS